MTRPLLATSSNSLFDLCFVSQKAPYDVARNVCQALDKGKLALA